MIAELVLRRASTRRIVARRVLRSAVPLWLADAAYERAPRLSARVDDALVELVAGRLADPAVQRRVVIVARRMRSSPIARRRR